MKEGRANWLLLVFGQCLKDKMVIFLDWFGEWAHIGGWSYIFIHIQSVINLQACILSTISLSLFHSIHKHIHTQTKRVSLIKCTDGVKLCYRWKLYEGSRFYVCDLGKGEWDFLHFYTFKLNKAHSYYSFFWLTKHSWHDVLAISSVSSKHDCIFSKIIFFCTQGFHLQRIRHHTNLAHCVQSLTRIWKAIFLQWQYV